MMIPKIFESHSGEVFTGFFGKPLNFLENSTDCIVDWKKLELPSPAYMKQVHGTSLQVVISPGKYENIDSLITTQQGLPLLVKMADCIAALVYDPTTRTIAVVHAGWRGLAEKIFSKSIETLERQFGSNPRDILVALSPSIHTPQFTDPLRETPSFFRPFIDKDNCIDLWEIAQQELLKNGVQRKNIEMPAFCTYIDTKKRFRSHRRGDQGRNGAVICLM